MSTRCTTCTRLVSSPYRAFLDGEIVEGCVDACHGEWLLPGTLDHAWHVRAESDVCRGAVATGRRRALSATNTARVLRLKRITEARQAVATHAASARYWARQARRAIARHDDEDRQQCLEIMKTDRALAREWRAERARLESR